MQFTVFIELYCLQCNVHSLLLIVFTKFRPINKHEPLKSIENLNPIDLVKSIENLNPIDLVKSIKNLKPVDL